MQRRRQLRSLEARHPRQEARFSVELLPVALASSEQSHRPLARSSVLHLQEAACLARLARDQACSEQALPRRRTTTAREEMTETMMPRRKVRSLHPSTRTRQKWTSRVQEHRQSSRARTRDYSR